MDDWTKGRLHRILAQSLVPGEEWMRRHYKFLIFFTTNEKEYVLVRNWWHVVMITA